MTHYQYAVRSAWRKVANGAQPAPIRPNGPFGVPGRAVQGNPNNPRWRMRGTGGHANYTRNMQFGAPMPVPVAQQRAMEQAKQRMQMDRRQRQQNKQWRSKRPLTGRPAPNSTII